MIEQLQPTILRRMSPNEHGSSRIGNDDFIGKPCQRDYTYLEARKYSDLLVSSAQSVIQSLTYSLTTRSPKYEKLSVQERWGVRFFAS